MKIKVLSFVILIMFSSLFFNKDVFSQTLTSCPSNYTQAVGADGVTFCNLKPYYIAGPEQPQTISLIKESTKEASYSDPNKWLPLIQCGGVGQHSCNFTEMANTVNRVINWFISMSAVVAAITFAIAGAKMLMNPENPGKREEAIEMFKKTVIGLIIVLAAWLIVKTVVGNFVDPDINALRYLDVAK